MVSILLPVYYGVQLKPIFCINYILIEKVQIKKEILGSVEQATWKKIKNIPIFKWQLGKT